MSSRREKIKKFIIVAVFWGVLTISFAFFGTLIVLKANGYHLNLKTWELSKTGMIVLDADPSGTLILNGSPYKKQGFPVKISSLSAGAYNIQIVTADYQSWERNISVSYGRASIYDRIKLFKTVAIETNAPENMTLENLTTESKNYQSGLVVSGSEIFFNEALVTRFSQDIASAVMMPDNYHVVVQLANEVRVVDLDGSNNKLLFTLLAAQETPLSFRQSGNIVLYWDYTQSKAMGRIVR